MTMDLEILHCGVNWLCTPHAQEAIHSTLKCARFVKRKLTCVPKTFKNDKGTYNIVLMKVLINMLTVVLATIQMIYANSNVILCYCFYSNNSVTWIKWSVIW